MSIKNFLDSAGKAVAAATAASESSEYDKAASQFAKAADNLVHCLDEVLCAQASAYMASEKYADALQTAERAIRNKSNSSSAWYWKGMALLKDGKGELAKPVFQKAVSFEKQLSKKTAYMDCIARCDAQVEASKQAMTDVSTDVAMEVDDRDANGSVDAEEEIEEVKPSEPPKPKDPTRMDWYQSADFVTIDIYAKNVVKDNSVVDIQPGSIVARLQRPDKPDYVLEHELFDSVLPSESGWTASKFKVEVRLKKAHPGVSWVALDREAEEASVRVLANKVAEKRKADTANRHKTWNSVAERELKDYKEDDSAMAVFRQIYASADEDTRRAMAKSYSESGGQVLSTDWSEVRKKKVEYKPRD